MEVPTAPVAVVLRNGDDIGAADSVRAMAQVAGRADSYEYAYERRRSHVALIRGGSYGVNAIWRICAGDGTRVQVPFCTAGCETV